MKFTADRAELAEAVKWVAAAIDAKPSVPALGGIRIELDNVGSCVYLTAHNFDQVHAAVVLMDLVDAGGTVVAPGFIVRDLLGALRTDKVTVEADARRLNIKGGRSTYGVNLFAAGTWPAFPISDTTHRGVVDADDLRAALAVASAAADDDNPNVKLAGVRLEAVTEGRLTITGLQSPRLATTEVAWTPAGLIHIDARLPIKNLTEAVRGLTGQVTVAASESILTLADATRSVTLRLFDDNVPWPWRPLLGERHETVTVDADELRGAVRRAQLAGGKDSVVAMTVDSAEVVITGAGEEADGTEVVEADGEGSWTAKFGAADLTTVLSTLPAGLVELSFGAPVGDKPSLAITDKAGSFHHVMQPRRA